MDISIPYLNFSDRNCTRCNSTDTSRSKRRGVEMLLLHFAAWRPYRCNICGRRYYARAKHPEATAKRTLAPPVRH